MTGQGTGRQHPLDLLMVEDSDVDVELEADTLREAGLVADVRRIDEEPAFLAALDEQLPDAILADWTLPHFSGRRALEIARERCPDVPFIFVSGTILESTAIDALRQGATDYVYKHQLQQLGPALIRAIDEARALRALHVSEEKYRRLFESSRDALMVLNPPSWHFTDANLATLQMFGASSKDDFAKLGPWDVSPERQPDGRPSAETAQEMIATALREGSHFFEWEHRRLNGETFVADILLTRLETDGQVLLQATMRDISARKKVEDALRQREAELNESQRLAQIGSWDWNAVNDTIWWSEEYYRIYGFGPKQPPSNYVEHLKAYTRKSAEELDVVVKRTMETGEPYEVDLELAQPTPATRWITARGEAKRDASGKIWGLRGTAQNITERKQAEQELRVAAFAFEAQEGIFVTDASTVILRVNQAFSRLTGYSAEELIGRKPDILKSGRHAPDFYLSMKESLDRYNSWQGEIWNRYRNGEVHPAWLAIAAVTDAKGQVTNYIGTYYDLTQSKEADDKIQLLAFYDPLTGLPNRRLLLDRLQHSLAASGRHQNHVAVLFIDLDNFKTLNDVKGHDIGDLLLIEVASRLQTCVHEGDTVARLGGDEFVIMLEELSEDLQQAATQTEAVGDNILAAIGQPYSLKGYEYQCTTSIGISLFRHQEIAVDELLKRADTAMYEAKNAGRNTLRFYDPAVQVALEVRTTLESDLRRALAENQFRLYYQMQVDHTGHIQGAEALIRWQHTDRGLVSPLEFIPLAEETGLILSIGQWVLETACAQLVVWASRNEMADLSLAVNVSARQFRHPDFVNHVLTVLDDTGANPHKIKLEITESLLLHNVEDIIAKMTVLKARGLRFSLDDFGTGYSSMQYLKRLSLDQLKIDQSFVRDIAIDSSDQAIVRTIIAMAQSLNLDVIAEGVETEEQRSFLEQHGCTHYQGYLFGRPVPIEEFEARLKNS